MFSWSAKCGFIDFNESQPLMTLRFVFGNWSGIHLRAVDDNDGWGKNGRSLAGERGNAMFETGERQCCRNPRLALSSSEREREWQCFTVMAMFAGEAMQCLTGEWQCCRNPRLALSSSVHLSLLITICQDAESGCCPARGERIYLICSTSLQGLMLI